MKGKMKAAIFEGNGVLNIKQVDMPKISDGDDIVLKVEACSVCGTDVHMLNVPPTFIANTGIALGHEIVASVVEVGTQVTKIKPGDRVIVNPNIYCGKCEYCLKDMTNHCLNMVSIGVNIQGGFSQYLKAKEKVCYRISDQLSMEDAIFAEPLACVLGALKKIKPMPGESVVLIGAGPIALMFLKMLKTMGAYPVIVSEPKADRRNKAKEQGADFVLDPSKDDFETFVKKIRPGGVDYAIDVVGSQMQSACSVVRKRGKVLLFGVNMKAESSILQHTITLNEISILGTYVDDATYPLAVDILEKGIVDLKPLITHTLPLEKVTEGIELLKMGKGLEIIIVP